MCQRHLIITVLKCDFSRISVIRLCLSGENRSEIVALWKMSSLIPEAIMKFCSECSKRSIFLAGRFHRLLLLVVPLLIRHNTCVFETNG